jgi:hypothetical protein
MLEQAKVRSGISKFMRFSRLFGPAGLVLLMLSIAAPLAGATVEDVTKNIRNVAPAQRKAILDEGARKEGEVICYTSMSLTDFPKIVGAFEKSVPYVKVRTNRLSQSSILPKIETEARAGRFAVCGRLGADGNVGVETKGLFWRLSLARAKGFSKRFFRSPRFLVFGRGDTTGAGLQFQARFP